ncbi:conjugal transfer protein TraL [Acetobacteraceae bacterium]|nr:conjugal transfer protein TraL [Acetobacteraceae bacterium]
MKAIHFILQGKGGVGKSFISTMLAQYLLEANIPITCLDTDPVNSTFQYFKKLSVRHEKITNEHNVIDDFLIQKLALDILKTMETAKANNLQIIVDNGATSFLPINNFLANSEAFSVFHEAGNEVFVHTILTGGAGMIDTFQGLEHLLKTFLENCKLVVWENPYFGKIESNGMGFEDTTLYSENKDKILGIIKLPTWDTLSAYTIEKIMNAHLTFSEVNTLWKEGEKEGFDIFTAQRAKNIKKKIFTQIDPIGSQFL